MSADRRVLLFVLSDEALRSRFNQLLAATPHAAFYCFDGADGFDRFLEARPDLCFVSESTSRISGSILSQLIREHRLSKGAGVYMLSPRWQDQELVDRLKGLGIDGVLPEPPDEAQMAEVLARGHVFAGESIDAVEEEVIDHFEDAVAQPVAAAAGDVFTGGEDAKPQSLSVRLRPPSKRLDAAVAVPAAVVELTPAMQKQPDGDKTRSEEKEHKPSKVSEKNSRSADEAPPFAALSQTSHDPESLENVMLALSQVPLSPPESDDLGDKDTSPSSDAGKDSAPEPFSTAPSPGYRDATTAQHEVPAGVVPTSSSPEFGNAAVEQAEPETAPPQDNNSQAEDATAPSGEEPHASPDFDASVAAEDPTPVGEIEMARVIPDGSASSSDDAATHEDPTPVNEINRAQLIHEDPTPVVEISGDSQLASLRQADDLSPVEEPTPVEERPVGSWDLKQALGDGDVFEPGEPRLEENATIRRPAATDGDLARTPFASVDRSDPEHFTPTNASGIFPLAPEERDSHTIRQAITDSQLGGRLTRRILALYRLLDSVDYYQLLGVAMDADRREIQQAYHVLAMEYHPDRFFILNPGFIKERVGSLFMRITEAYTVISDDERRARYDAMLGEIRDGQPPRFTLGESMVEDNSRRAEAQTPVGRKYLRLAFAAMARGDLDAAHLNLTFAVGHEPDNGHLRERLGAVESQLRAGS